MRINRIVRWINVYSGIPPALLASMSMGAQIKAASQAELTATLKKNGIISSPEVEKTLNSIDRRLFTNDADCYNNKPCRISDGQNMTDALTHALVL